MTSNRPVAPDGSTASLPNDEVSRFIALEGGKNEHQAEASLRRGRLQRWYSHTRGTVVATRSDQNSCCPGSLVQGHRSKPGIEKMVRSSAGTLEWFSEALLGDKNNVLFHGKAPSSGHRTSNNDRYCALPAKERQGRYLRDRSRRLFKAQDSTAASFVEKGSGRVCSDR